MFKQSCADFNKLKQRYKDAHSQATSIISVIETDSKWGWAHNEQNKGLLQAEMRSMVESISGLQGLMSQQLTSLKKQYSEKELLAQMADFKKISPGIDKVEQTHAMLLVSQQARIKSEKQRPE